MKVKVKVKAWCLCVTHRRRGPWGRVRSITVWGLLPGSEHEAEPARNKGRYAVASGNQSWYQEVRAGTSWYLQGGCRLQSCAGLSRHEQVTMQTGTAWFMHSGSTQGDAPGTIFRLEIKSN